MRNFRLFHTERVCRNNFKYDENGRKFFKGVENVVGKGEIAHHEQFLLFQQCFQLFKRPVLQTCKTKGLFGKGLRMVDEYGP